MVSSEKLERLIDLAREPSSERRRDLLRQVTDIFFEAEPVAGSGLQAQFDGVLSSLAAQAALEARETLAHRFADAKAPPRALLLSLARDAIEVAGPILRRSGALSDDDLAGLARETSQAHLRAISQRERLSAPVTEAVVDRGDDETVATLLANPRAELSRGAFETVARRAETSRRLHAPFIARTDAPPDLLADLALVVESALRDQIAARFERLAPGVLEAALAASQARLAKRIKEDHALAEAKHLIAKRKAAGRLDGPYLIELLREKQPLAVCAGLAELAGVGIAAGKRAYEHDSVDGLALLCKAAGFDKAVFVSLAVLRANAKAGALDEARTLGALYEALPQATAERALRFWRLRQKAQAA